MSSLPKEDEHGWHSGVSMADVNNDGWLDVYVCRAGWYKDPGQTEQPALPEPIRDGTFKEVAEAWGWRIPRAAPRIFFDRDKDGDLDLFVINTPLQSGSKLFNDDIARHRSSSAGARAMDCTATMETGSTDITRHKAGYGTWAMVSGFVSDLDGNGIGGHLCCK